MMTKGKNPKKRFAQNLRAGLLAGVALCTLSSCSSSSRKEETGSTLAPITYFIAVDVSESMKTGNLHERRTSIMSRLVQEMMNAEDRVIIYKYASTCTKESEGYAKWEEIAPLAEKYSSQEKISKERGTNPALPLEKVLQDAPTDTRFAIILITDGEILDRERLQSVIKKLSEKRNLVAILTGPLNSDLNLRDPFEDCFRSLNETNKKRFFSFGNQTEDFQSAIDDFKKAIQQ